MNEIDYRTEIVNISKQFPHLRFGQFLDDAVRAEYGYDSIHYPSDEILLELCQRYAKKLNAKS